MSLRRFNLVLMIVGVALGVVTALLVTRDDSGAAAAPASSPAEERSRAYLDVSDAASVNVEAFLGIDHTDVEAQTQAVLDGAAGAFKEQYATQRDGIIRSAQRQESTAVATILDVGVVDLDDTSATLLVAANTAVTSKATQGATKTVPWRIQLEMVNEGGQWLTSELTFVG